MISRDVKSPSALSGVRLGVGGRLLDKLPQLQRDGWYCGGVAIVIAIIGNIGFYGESQGAAPRSGSLAACYLVCRQAPKVLEKLDQLRDIIRERFKVSAI